MQITLSDDDKRLINERDRKIEWLRSAIQAGPDDFAKGDFEEWTSELMERLFAESERDRPSSGNAISSMLI